GPPAAGAAVRQPRPGGEPEFAAEQAGLRHRGVPVGAPVATDDGQLDAAGHLGRADPVTLSEPLGGLSLDLGHWHGPPGQRAIDAWRPASKARAHVPAWVMTHPPSPAAMGRPAPLPSGNPSASRRARDPRPVSSRTASAA